MVLTEKTVAELTYYEYRILERGKNLVFFGKIFVGTGMYPVRETPTGYKSISRLFMTSP